MYIEVVKTEFMICSRHNLSAKLKRNLKMTLKNNQINVNLRQKTSLIDNRGGFLTIYKTNNHNKNRSENLKKSHHIHNTNIFFFLFFS